MICVQVDSLLTPGFHRTWTAFLSDSESLHSLFFGSGPQVSKSVHSWFCRVPEVSECFAVYPKCLNLFTVDFCSGPQVSKSVHSWFCSGPQVSKSVDSWFCRVPEVSIIPHQAWLALAVRVWRQCLCLAVSPEVKSWRRGRCLSRPLQEFPASTV